MKVAFYARVSEDDLHCENQKAALAAWQERNCMATDTWEYFQEEETTRKTRPIKEDIIKAYRAGTYDTVVCVQVGRWARSLIELVQDVEGIVNSGGRYISINDGFDFRKDKFNAAAQLQLHMFAAFAQFEREIIRERTYAGLARAKGQGKIGGRHPVECGCGKVMPNGNVHNGIVKPMRDEHNRLVGWRWPDGHIRPVKQTPPPKPYEKTEERPAEQHTGV